MFFSFIFDRVICIQRWVKSNFYALILFMSLTGHGRVHQYQVLLPRVRHVARPQIGRTSLHGGYQRMVEGTGNYSVIHSDPSLTIKPP